VEPRLRPSSRRNDDVGVDIIARSPSVHHGILLCGQFGVACSLKGGRSIPFFKTNYVCMIKFSSILVSLMDASLLQVKQRDAISYLGFALFYVVSTRYI
jgi:hypothetical protein